MRIPQISNIVNKMQKKSRSKDNQPVDIKTVDKFELSRYLGVWHEIARYNHRFERGLRNVKAEYTIRDDGRIKVVNTGMDEQSGRKKEVVGKAKTTAVSGLLRVSFFWIFYSDYRIDRKSTRLNSSHQIISYAVFCLK